MEKEDLIRVLVEEGREVLEKIDNLQRCVDIIKVALNDEGDEAISILSDHLDMRKGEYYDISQKENLLKEEILREEEEVKRKIEEEKRREETMVKPLEVPSYYEVYEKGSTYKAFIDRSLSYCAGQKCKKRIYWVKNPEGKAKPVRFITWKELETLVLIPPIKEAYISERKALGAPWICLEHHHDCVDRYKNFSAEKALRLKS